MDSTRNESINNPPKAAWPGNARAGAQPQPACFGGPDTVMLSHVGGPAFRAGTGWVSLPRSGPVCLGALLSPLDLYLPPHYLSDSPSPHHNAIARFLNIIGESS